ncbi:MAG: prolyl oligopeptidase family serine peptidase [Bryobacterales bacterium]|nr:prolyl oligopeptidase family serine peptidase [Bryobacterales bacterium]
MPGILKRAMRRLPLLVFAAICCAQDAEMVLSTSVRYNTMKASLPLTDEQRKEADKLGSEAMQLGFTGRTGDAMRNLYRGMAVMRGAAWTPVLELAASLQPKLNHHLIAPGNTVTLALKPLYSSGTADQTMKVALVLKPAKGDGAEKEIATSTITGTKLPASIDVALPPGVTGDYFLEARLTDSEGNFDAKAKDAFVKTMPVRIQSFVDEARKLEKRLAAADEKKHPSVTTAALALSLYERADRGEANPHRADVSRTFATANEILDAVEKGKDPFAGKTGDFHRAYRSAVDKTLQPYRLYVPERYDAAKPASLVVALHGMGGDENSMFDLYAAGLIKREAEKRGFFVVAPKGRGPASMYRGDAEKDVLAVIGEVRRDYAIDAERIYVMGHSMGGFGSWSIAMNHPDLFAALGPVAGGGNPSRMAAIKHVPQFVVHGDNDRTVPVTQSRNMVEAARKAGATVEYVEVPGGNHIDIVVPNIAAMFDFFAKQKRVVSF